jgi:hypothetical protein
MDVPCLELMIGDNLQLQLKDTTGSAILLRYLWNPDSHQRASRKPLLVTMFDPAATK